MIRVVQMGLGPIGRSIAKSVGGRPGLKLVGAVDPDPALAGADLGTVIGGEPLGLEVRPAFDAIDVPVDLVLHATGSSLREVASQLQPLLDRGLHVLSTCEELAYPYYRYPELSKELDSAARENGAALLGSGVNPGFVMDKFVVSLMGACIDVQSVHVKRVVDAGVRREPFQRKVGAGITAEEFEDRRDRLGHVGLAESAHMLADVMGLPHDRELVESLDSVIAKERRTTRYIVVEQGRVAGIRQSATIRAAGRESVRMDLLMAVGAERPRDAVKIGGSPPLTIEISTGVHGDVGTAAVILNCAHLVPSLAPGLRTMLDVPLRPTLGEAS